ncbi:aminoglycoside 3'-phosphotransferase [Microbacterium sp. NPDC080220]|uniref:aminoglycoside 3'-phosphotransferase n=1 Tax=Microbacterium sp. NPDC080220 TaxID=3161017 RepID=UPI00343BE894
MSIPPADAPVPPIVRRLARDAALLPVWENKLGGQTFRTDDDRFIKIGPVHLETSMADEAERMAWAAPYVRVPTVIEQGDDGETEWLVTRALTGLSAVDPTWVARPETAVRAIGEGLHALHESLPAASCPFDWTVPSRVANAAARGVVVPDELREAPPIEQLVVCHGDACAPNTLIGDDGRWSGHVDLGQLGLGDRWGDIAVAAMSTGWNYGPGWDGLLLEAYGVAPDEERIAYYRDLWNAT